MLSAIYSGRRSIPAQVAGTGSGMAVAAGVAGVVTPHALNTKLMITNRVPTVDTFYFITFLR